MERKLTCVLIFLFVLIRTGPAQISISIDGQKDIFYDPLSSSDEGYLAISHSDYIPLNGLKPAGDDDLSAQVWMTWDRTYLYFYAEVRDDIVLVNNDAANQNDCIEVIFDPDPALKPLSGLFHIRLTALDSAQADNISGVDNLNSDSISDPKGITVNPPTNYARRRTATGYVVEFRLAWKRIVLDHDLTLQASVGNIFGLAVNFHDNDSEQRDKSIQWSAGMADEVWNTPQLLGSVEFLPGNKLKLVKRNAIDPYARPGTAYLSNQRFASLEKILGADLLIENWKYQPGDDASWADPALDDSDWETTTSFLHPANLPASGWPGIAWFRLHIVIDSSLFNSTLGLSLMQAGVSHIYLDGKLIYTFGAQDGDWTGLPKVLTFTDSKRHVLALRYSNRSVSKFHNAGYISGFALQLGKLNQMSDNSIRRERTFIGFQMFFTSLSLAIGLLHLILFSFFPSLRQNLYFALFLFAYAATIYFDYQNLLATDIGQKLSVFRLHCAMLPFWIIFQLRFVYSLFYKKIPIQFWIISLVALFLGALIVYKPGQYFSYFGIMYILIYIEIPRVIAYAFIKKIEGTWIIASAFFVFFIFGVLDTLMDAGYFVALREIENPYAFGSVSFFIAMSVYLSRDFARTNKKIAEQELEQRLLEAENARQAKELEQARQLQLSMLPAELPQIANLDIGVYMKTATEVGGDYYDFNLNDDRTLTVVIGDATGHGMQAGTMVSVIKGLFIADASQMDILSFFKKCNQTIKQMHLGNLYMALMLIKIKANKMTVSSAGIPPIYIYRTVTKSVEEVLIKGMPMGGITSFSYEQREINLVPGDTVLLMTDGFPELFNPHDEMLDYPRVKQIFLEAADRSADEIITHLSNEGESWRHDRPQDDDITFVVLKAK